MTDKELRKLSREDLLEMLISQSKEVKQLKEERDTLIEQLKYFKAEFDKVGSLDAILNRLGIPRENDDDAEQTSALDELLLQFENEESTMELFENEKPGTGKAKKKSSLLDFAKTKKSDVRKDEGRVRTEKKADKTDTESADALQPEERPRKKPKVSEPVIRKDKDLWDEFEVEEESANVERDAFEKLDEEAEEKKGAFAENDEEANVNPTDHMTDDNGAVGRGSGRSGSKKPKEKQNRVQEALAWAKMQFGDKKK